MRSVVCGTPCIASEMALIVHQILWLERKVNSTHLRSLEVDQRCAGVDSDKAYTGAGPFRLVTLTLTHCKAKRRHRAQGSVAASGCFDGTSGEGSHRRLSEVRQ